MLSSKKNRLIDCLLKRITTPTSCLVCSSSARVLAEATATTSTSTNATWGIQSTFCNQQNYLPIQSRAANVDETSKPFTTRLLDLFGYCCPRSDKINIGTIETPKDSKACRKQLENMVKSVLQCFTEKELLKFLNLIETEGFYKSECFYLTKKYGCDCLVDTYDDHHFLHDSTNCWSRLASHLPAHKLLFLSYRWENPSPRSWSSEDIIYLPWFEHQSHPSSPTLTQCINPYHYCFLVESSKFSYAFSSRIRI